MRNTARLGTLGLAALLAACANDSATTAPTSSATLNSDVAAFTAEAVGQDIEFMHGPRGQWGLGFGGEFGRFDCVTVERDGFTFERTCTYYDGAGAEQEAYDALTTASAAFHVSLSGSFDRGDWGSSSFSHTRDLTVTGLEGEETARTWNGTGSGMMTGIRMTRDSATVQMDMTSTGSITDLVIPVPRTETSWPLSGTITYSVSVTFTGGVHDGETKTRDVTVTFDGTQYATVTVNGETFTIDLAKRRCEGKGDGHDGRKDDGHDGPGGMHE